MPRMIDPAAPERGASLESLTGPQMRHRPRRTRAVAASWPDSGRSGVSEVEWRETLVWLSRSSARLPSGKGVCFTTQ